MNTILSKIIKTLALGLVLVASVHSVQATAIAHTYVSGYGNDANPCTFTQPCASFQTALTNTSSGGVITALDAGDYGRVDISQAVTIDGTGTQAGIVMNTNATAITISAGTADTVVLRHLSITGLASSTIGIGVMTGALEMDDCKVCAFRQNDLDISSTAGNAIIENSSFTRSNGNGISCSGSGFVSLRNVTLQGNKFGMEAGGGPVDISHSLISQNTIVGVTATQGTVSILNCIVTGNGAAVYAGGSATIRLTNNDIFNNATGISAGNTGVVSTAGNNHKAGSTTPGAPTPGRVIVVQ